MQKLDSNRFQDSYSLPHNALLVVNKFKVEGHNVEVTNNMREFGIELHFTNGPFTGSVSDYLELHNQVQHILDTYKER